MCEPLCVTSWLLWGHEGFGDTFFIHLRFLIYTVGRSNFVLCTSAAPSPFANIVHRVQGAVSTSCRAVMLVSPWVPSGFVSNVALVASNIFRSEVT